jgi:hypothetical protein
MILQTERGEELVGYVKELRPPMIRECFEDIALEADQKS